MGTTLSSVQLFGQHASWPEGCVYIGMPGRAASAFGIVTAGPFGKPWHLLNDERGWAAAYIEYLAKRLLADPSFEAQVKALAGKTLLCWCTKKASDRQTEVPCHGRILLEYVELLNQ